MAEDTAGAGRSTEQLPSSATDVSLREHLAQRLTETEHRIDERDRYLREADWRLAQERDRRYAELAEERDRRYGEVSVEREKTLLVKEAADQTALDLAREIQAYKDEKANQLREQIENERGIYLKREEYLLAHGALIDKLDASLEPIKSYIAVQQGKSSGIGASAGFLFAAIVAVGGIVGIVTTILVATH